MRRYVSEATERWEGFEHRSGDIVISTRSKCGTTWMQMICLTLIHGTPLPAPLSLLSPWVDWDIEPTGAVHERLAGQDYRRVIKTHTPLAGIPLSDDVRYIVVGRHPLDVAVSMYHHVGNLDQVRSAQLRDRPPTEADRGTLDEWVDAWTCDTRPPQEALDTLAGNVHHITDALQRREGGNVLLVHFDELVKGREVTTRRIAAWLGIEANEARWADVVAATSFESMSADPARTVPDHLGILKDPAAFFRSGSVGDGLRSLAPETVGRYDRRLASIASPRVIGWLHQT